MSSNPTDSIIKLIDKIFINQTGPFGQIVCEESLAAWQQSQVEVSNKNIAFYIKLLLTELDQGERQIFLSELGKHPGIANIIAVKQFLNSNP